MISDTIGPRFLSLLYGSVQETINITKLPTPSKLLEYYKVGDTILTQLGNLGYDHIKQIESLCIASYLATKEPLRISRDYINQLLNVAGDDTVLESNMKLLYDVIL